MPLPEAQTSQELLSEVVKGMPVLAVMWYMLKDLKERFKEDRQERKEAAKAALDKIEQLEKQMPAIWAIIGERESDLKHPRRKAS